jgi:hypothetical protein
MRERLLLRLADFVSRHPWRAGLLLLSVTVVFGALAAQLTLSMAMTNLMPQDDPMVQEFDRVMEEFAGAASMLVVAEGDPERLIVFADSVAPQIEALTHLVKKVNYAFPRELYADHGLMLMKASDLENTQSLFADPNFVEFLRNLNDGFEREYIASDEQISGQEQEQGVIRFMDGIQSLGEVLHGVLDGDLEGSGARAVDAVLFGDLYYRSWDRRMLIMQVIPTFSFLDVDKDVEATNSVEQLVYAAADKFGVRAGLTGAIPLARDEMHAVESDSFIISTLALVGILILFVVAFRMVVSPLLALITLVFGVVWALGVAWLLVGTLNLMTSMMAVVLIGLGIDFSIHIIAVYTELRARGEESAAALRVTLRKTGMGILTGGLTTAAAFLTMTVSRTAGMREFGLVLGLGIIMTMLAALTVLPVLLVLRERLVERWRPERSAPPRRDITYQKLGGLAQFLSRRWALSGIVLVAAVVWLGYRGSQITMDYNYLNMEPVGLESIRLQDRIIDKLNLSSDYAYITTTDLDEAQRITDAAKKMFTSGMVQSIVDYLPSETEQNRRRQAVTHIRAAMAQAEIRERFTEEDYEQLVTEVERLVMNVMEIQDLAVIGGQDKVYLKTGLLVGVVPEEEAPTVMALQRELAAIVPDIETGILVHLQDRLAAGGATAVERLGAFQRQFARAFKPAVLRMANPEPITLATLPETVRRQFIGTSGELYLITVFPRGNVWDQLFLKRFSAELQAISPRTTGLPPVYLRLIELIGHDGKVATGLALLVIFLLLLADFKSLRKALLAVVPLVIGVVWMLGVMQLSGLQLTMLNIMAIPLIIGIGIDDGVHVLHRYQIEGRQAHRTVFASTGRAVLLTSLTTMLGFGSLWFATYRGLGSMGIALFIGVGTCFLATVLVLPPVMGMIQRWKDRRTVVVREPATAVGSSD